MVIRKVIVVGTALAVTFPPPFLRECKLAQGDLATVELGRNDEIIIRRVDLKALAAQRKQDDKARK